MCGGICSEPGPPAFAVYDRSGRRNDDCSQGETSMVGFKPRRTKVKKTKKRSKRS